MVSQVGRESSTEAIKLPNIFVQAMFYQTLIYEKQIEQKSEHWPVVEAGEKWSVHTLEFVLAHVDGGRGIDRYLACLICQHTATLWCPYPHLSK